MRISEGVHQLCIPVNTPLLTVNCYLLKEGNDAYLVDAAWPMDGAWEKLMGLFAEAEVDPSRLTGIILTHAHQDHTGYLDRIQELSGAPVLLHQAEEAAQQTWITADPVRQAAWRSWYDLHGVPSDVAASMMSSRTPQKSVGFTNPRWLSAGEVIPVGTMNWEVVWTPGHSPGHICLLERSRRLLITGDHVLPHESPNVAVRPNMALNPLGTYISSLHELLALPIDKALPGHSDAFENFEEVVQYLIGHHDARFNDILGAVSKGPIDAYRVAGQIPWVKRAMRFAELAPHDQFLAFGETLAHLECLAGWGKVQRIELPSKHTLWSLAGQ